jgi:dUTP pyrophosphatase
MDVAARLLSETARLPERAHADDAAFDLCADESVVLAPGGRALVGTGVAVELPAGSAGLVLPRSGLAARHGISLVNGPGLIDPGYRGEIKVILLNTDRDEPFEIGVGDRIAQLLIVQSSAQRIVEASAELEASTRGAGGFGSTGR